MINISKICNASVETMSKKLSLNTVAKKAFNAPIKDTFERSILKNSKKSLIDPRVLNSNLYKRLHSQAVCCIENYDRSTFLRLITGGLSYDKKFTKTFEKEIFSKMKGFSFSVEKSEKLLFDNKPFSGIVQLGSKTGNTPFLKYKKGRLVGMTSLNVHNGDVIVSKFENQYSTIKLPNGKKIKVVRERQSCNGDLFSINEYSKTDGKNIRSTVISPELGRGRYMDATRTTYIDGKEITENFALPCRKNPREKISESHFRHRTTWDNPIIGI